MKTLMDRVDGYYQAALFIQDISSINIDNKGFTKPDRLQRTTLEAFFHTSVPHVFKLHINITFMALKMFVTFH
jgi:hypothetical protein